MTFRNLRLANGYNGMRMQGGFYISLDRVTTSGFSGQHVVALNGQDDSVRCDAVTITESSLSPGAGNPNNDCLVIDGLADSTKITNTAFLFGRHGLTMRNTAMGAPRIITALTASGTGEYLVTTGAAHGLANGAEALIMMNDGSEPSGTWFVAVTSSVSFTLLGSNYSANVVGGIMQATTGKAPSFLYMTAGGFENGVGDAVRLEAGKLAQFSNVYNSSDGDGVGIRELPTWGGQLIVNGGEIRGHGRDGYRAARGLSTFAGVDICNNGRSDLVATNVTGAVDSGTGAVRLTLPGHAFATDDWASIAAIGGVPAAIGEWKVSVVSASQIDLVGSNFTGAYTSGGVATRLSANVRIMPTASRVNVDGGKIGRDPTGLNRAAYGVINEADNIFISADMIGNRKGAFKNTRVSRNVRIAARGVVDQGVECLTITIAGAVANGVYQWTNRRFLAGETIRIIRIVRQLVAGTCSIRPRIDTAAILTSAVAVTTTASSTTLSTPREAINAGGIPGVLDLEVIAASGAIGLTVEVYYQRVGG